MRILSVARRIHSPESIGSLEWLTQPLSGLFLKNWNLEYRRAFGAFVGEDLCNSASPVKVMYFFLSLTLSLPLSFLYLHLLLFANEVYGK